MDLPVRQPRFSFQTKVLAPVLVALVLLPALTLWIVNRYLNRQMQDESRQALLTAEGVFLNSLEIRTRNLASRFRNAVNDPRFKATARLGDSKTLTNYLRELLDELRDENELILYTNDQGQLFAQAQRDPANNAAEFARVAAPIVRHALDGELGTGTVSTGGRSFNVVAVPVLLGDSGPLIGALTIATRLSETAMLELKSLTHADLLLFSDKTITASTIRQPELPSELLPSVAKDGPARVILPVEMNGEHFLALAGTYEPSGPQRGFRYVLLSSYEQRMHELMNARLTLLGVSLLGVFLSGTLVWFLIRRVTHPLVALRDSVEAVGRGDLTRRIERFSNDECGDVAEAFNRMTLNLQSSRADLEKAVETIKTTQAQLIQSEKLSAVGQFVAGVAHELNNPLTSVIGFSELLQSTNLNPAAKEHIDIIAKNALRCHKIVHSLLGFSRQHEPERKLAQLHEIVDAVIEIVAYDMRTNNITLVREFAPDLPRILADSHQLQQVILNILSNARQATEAFRRDGRIVLRTGTSATQVWLRIKDNGPGIPHDYISRIFDPFFTTKPQGKGTGLGLSLSYGIIQEHKGTIRVESEPGEGAEFIIGLPLAEIPHATTAKAKAISASPFGSAAPALTVLVIDDEESILQLVQEVLRREGHKVDSATNGEAALALIGKRRYDVIISDWKMPGLTGMQIYEDLLASNPAAARQMLFMTGDVIKSSFQDFLIKHGLACLPKPFSIWEFRAAVARLGTSK